MRIQFKLNDTLAQELELAARGCQMSPANFAGQVLEAALADRRLARIPATDSRPRMMAGPDDLNARDSLGEL